MPTNHTKLEDIEPTGRLALEGGRQRRKIKLRLDEQRALKKQELIEAAAALFLDLGTVRSWGEIAKELGISVSTLQEITKSKEFDEVFNAMFAEVGHDPRYKAMQAEMGNILPIAVRELKNLIVSSEASPNVKLKAIELVFKTTNFTTDELGGSDKNDLIAFLKEMRRRPMDVENMNIAIVGPEALPFRRNEQTYLDGGEDGQPIIDNG